LGEYTYYDDFENVENFDKITKHIQDLTSEDVSVLVKPGY